MTISKLAVVIGRADDKIVLDFPHKKIIAGEEYSGSCTLSGSVKDKNFDVYLPSKCNGHKIHADHRINFTLTCKDGPNFTKIDCSASIDSYVEVKFKGKNNNIMIISYYNLHIYP